MHTLPRSGQRRNSTATLFSARCIRIWNTYSKRPAPGTVKKDSPICRFVLAAIPGQVFEGTDVSTRVREAISLYGDCRQLPIVGDVVPGVADLTDGRRYGPEVGGNTPPPH